MERKKLLIVGIALLLSAAVIGRIAWHNRPARIPAAKLKSVPMRPGELPPAWDAPAFAFVDQDGQPMDGDALKGKVWVADFIFTRCGNTCPVMTAKMIELHKRITDPRVVFVSFSVDPDRDKPADLKAYAAKYKVDESRWRFLSPPDAKSILNVAVGMRITGPPKENNNPLLHADRFLLIDQHLKVRGSYYEGDEEAMRRLVSDATGLARLGSGE
jgi:protein SCO1/2